MTSGLQWTAGFSTYWTAQVSSGGTADGDDVARLREEFARDGSLKSYIELRRRYPKRAVNVARFAGLDPLFAIESTLEEVGIDPELVAGALDAAEEYVEELSLQLIERIHQRQELEKQGRTQVQSRNLGLSDSLINYLAVTMLEAVERFGAPMPPSLLVLLRQQLGGAQPELHQSYRTRKKRDDAIFIAIQLQEQGIEPGVRKIAEVLQVEPSTVSRWFPGGSLLQEVERTRRGLFPGTPRQLREKLGLPPKE